MKIAAVTVLYKTSQAEITRLKKELLALGIKDFYYVDHTKTQKGYAEGINSLVRKHLQTYDTFLVMNPDVSLEKMKSERKELGSKSDTFTDGLSKYDILGFAMEQNGVLYAGGELDKWRMSGGLIAAEVANTKKRFRDVEFVSGSCMLIKAAVFKKIGFFDESFGMYYEDVDFCFRAAQAGLQVGIDMQNCYEHFELSVHNKNKSKQLARSRWLFFNRNSSLQQKAYELLHLPKTILELYGMS